MPATAKAKPPILTTDNKTVTVGMKLYCFDDCAVPIKLQTLTVIDIDLGRARSIRLRRSNKREWTWTAVDRQGVCRSQNHYLYADKEKAQAEIVKRNKAKEREAVARDLKSAEGDLARLCTWLKQDIVQQKKRRGEVAEAKKKVAGLRKKLAAVGK